MMQDPSDPVRQPNDPANPESGEASPQHEEASRQESSAHDQANSGGPAEEAASSSEQAGQAERPSDRIKIGSLRDLYKRTDELAPRPEPLHTPRPAAETAPPRPVPPSRPAAPPLELKSAEAEQPTADVTAEEQPRPSQPHEPQPPQSHEQAPTTPSEAAGSSTQPASAEAVATPAPPPAAPETPPDKERPSRRRRGEKGKSRDAARDVEPPRKPTVPRPNVRQQLPPELEQELEEALGGASLDSLLDSSNRPAPAELAPEARVQGAILSVRHEEVFIDLGGRNQGVVSLAQFKEPPELGTPVEAIVIRFDSEEGLYELNLPGASVDVSGWEELSEGLVVDAVITGHNKGGLECTVGNLRGFIPASQISLYRVEDLEQFVGQKLPSVITEVNPERRNLVLSHRDYLERERAEAKRKLLEELAIGQQREGVVSSLRDFGAFIDLGGVDGLIHISRMSWDRIKHPSEVLEVGQRVKVKIEKIDETTGKIGLSLRDLSENPWNDVERKYPVKSVVRGTVDKIMDFGALVKLEPGISGLVHISELSHRRVWRVADVVEEGQPVDVQVLSVDAEAQRISLSMKALEARAEPKPSEEGTAEEDEPQAARSRVNPDELKGGLERSSGGKRFGLKW